MAYRFRLVGFWNYLDQAYKPSELTTTCFSHPVLEVLVAQVCEALSIVLRTIAIIAPLDNSRCSP